MPGASDIALGNIAYQFMLQATLSPTIVNTITTSDQAFTVNGLLAGDFIQVIKPTAQTGLALVHARVSAANTMNLTFMNPTAGNITPTAAEIYLVKVSRPENPGPLPTAIT